MKRELEKKFNNTESSLKYSDSHKFFLAFFLVNSTVHQQTLVTQSYYFYLILTNSHCLQLVVLSYLK